MGILFLSGIDNRIQCTISNHRYLMYLTRVYLIQTVKENHPRQYEEISVYFTNSAVKYVGSCCLNKHGN